VHTQQGEIGSEGALVELLVGLAAPNIQNLRNAGHPVPTAIPVRAVIDTAADVTCLDPAALAVPIAAGVPPTRFVYANLPAFGGLTFACEYLVSLTITHPSGDPRANLVLRNHPVIEQPLRQLGYQALIGRDVLGRCLFVYDGPGRVYTLGY
jgi:hypothetical protein